MNIRHKFLQSPIVELPIFSIDPSPYQSRRTFSQASLNELALSIRRNGLLQPITVREMEKGRYQLIAGERRLRACRIAGYATIRAQVIRVSDSDAALLCMVENLQREGLHYFDEAEGILNLMHAHGLTQEQVALQLGKQQSTIANKLRLLRLTAPVREALIRNGLTERHARALLRLQEEDLQLEVLGKVVEQGLNVRETDQLVEREMATAEASGLRRSRVLRAYSDWRLMDNTIRQAVNAMRQAGVAVQYDSRDMGDCVQIRVVLPKAEEPAKVAGLDP